MKRIKIKIICHISNKFFYELEYWNSDTKKNNKLIIKRLQINITLVKRISTNRKNYM